jgi:putative molybdopterin biosynthesis protein
MELFTVKEVAEKLKVTPPTVYRLQSEKKIESYKVGGQIRFSQKQIDEYLEAVRGDGNGPVPQN